MEQAGYQKGAKGRPTERLEQCPYDMNHYITVKKFGTHLETCRRNYKLKALETNGRIDVFVCQYNPAHLVYGPELDYHETRCIDTQSKVPYTYQLNVEPLREAGLWNYADQYSVTDDEMEAEMAEIFSGIDLNLVQGQEAYGRKIHMDDHMSTGATAQRMAENRAAALAKELEEDRIAEERQKQFTAEELEEEEEWNRVPDGPGFDYKKCVTSSKFGIPPTLTKSERKELEKKADEKGMYLTALNSSPPHVRWPAAPLDELDEMYYGLTIADKTESD